MKNVHTKKKQTNNNNIFDRLENTMRELKHMIRL